MITANGATGIAHDCFCYDAAGLVWNGTAFVAWVDANYVAYRVAATERGTSGTFTATEPAGTMRWEMRVRAGTLAGSYVVWAEDLTTSQIKAKTDLIGTGSAVVSAPVSGDGDLLELILETDYLAANGRALEWTFDEITGITTSATGKFGLKDALTGTEVYVNTTGTVTDLGSGTFKVSFNITNTALNALSPGKYDWSVEVLEGSYKITVARNRQIKTRVDIVEKQT